MYQFPTPIPFIQFNNSANFYSNFKVVKYFVLVPIIKATYCGFILLSHNLTYNVNAATKYECEEIIIILCLILVDEYALIYIKYLLHCKC